MNRLALPLSMLLALAAVPALAADATPSPTPAPSGPASTEATPKPAASATAAPEGFSLRSADGDFALRLRATLQADGRFHFGEEPPIPDGFLIRRARLEVTGVVYRDFEFRLMPDFAGSSTLLLDAWLKWNLSPALQVQIGKVKQPVGLERSQSREYTIFNELGYPTALVPNRDLGLDVQGSLAGGKLEYYLGVFDGAADGASVITDSDDNRELAARVFATPSKGLGVGLAGTHGTRERSAPSPFRTVGQELFFRWRDGVVDDGTTWRAVPQLYFHRGPFLVVSEYALSSHELRLGPAADEVEASAWTANVAWVLTGEDNTFRGVTPERPVGRGQKGGGAWLIAARAMALEVDDAAFPVFAAPTQASKAETVGVAVSWYANKVIRWTLDYNHTELDGGPLEEEDVAILRAQVRF